MDPTIIVTIVVALIGAGATLGAAVISYRAGGRRASQEPSSASGPPPKVVATNPSGQAEDADPNIRVTANFSKDMDFATINPHTFKLLDSSSLTPVPPAARTGVYYDELTRMAIFSPAAPLQNGRRYMADITARVKDPAGNSLGEDKIWHFTIRRSEHL
jgi:hypothetical protein